MIPKLILAIQLSGFFFALTMLFFPAHHGLFVTGFAVHLAGDLWRIKREGL
jgi:hypothetical protein